MIDLRHRIHLFVNRLPILIIAVLALCLWTAQPVRAQGPLLDITDINTTQYPTITLEVQYANLSPSQINSIQIFEDDQVIAQLDSVTLPAKRIGILLDSYNGLPVAILEKIADAFDALEYDPRKWESMELALFVPGSDGRSLVNQVDWQARVWREITNGVIAYHNGAGQNRPTAAGTALKDLTYSALQQVSAGAEGEKYLLVLTDGFDTGSVTTSSAISTTKAASDVRLIFVNYAPNVATDSRVQALTALAQETNSPLVDLSESTGLLPTWHDITAVNLTSQIVYETQNAPPFTLRAEVPGTEIASATETVSEYIPPVAVVVEEPAPDAIIKSESTPVTLHFLWPADYPARTIESARYAVAGRPEQAIDLSTLDADNRVTFQIDELVNGTNLLDVVVQETIPEFVGREQVMLHVNLPPVPTPIPATPVAVPTIEPVVTPAPPFIGTTFRFPPPVQNWLAWLRARLPRQFAPYIPDSVSLPNMLWGTVIFAAALAFLALLIALMAMRRANSWYSTPSAVYRPDRTDTHQKTTDTWSKAADERKAELILIQGEGMLPGVVGLQQGKTYFGRDFGQVDELLANRYVSQKQFCIWERNGQFFLGNCSISNPTIVNDGAAPSDNSTFPAEGPFLKSGDVIQFGPFKYRFLISRNGEPAPNIESANVPLPRHPNPLTNRRPTRS